MRIAPMAALLALALALSGCASTGSGGASERDVITADQLLSMSNTTAYQAIQRLKPRWLQRRGQQSFRFRTSLIVVVDDGSFYDVGFLHQLRTDDLQEIRYMDPREATLKLGERASGGAIVVTTR